MNVKTTEIKKKFKDKKTGQWKELSIFHAKVKDRLKVFWESNPSGKIETSSIIQGDHIIFKTFILADKANPASREATGHALANLPLGEKDYEKLETISVGRALALMGYATDGEVASFEEMEDFLSEKELKKQSKIQEIIEKVSKIKNVEELRELFKATRQGYGVEVDAILMEKAEEFKPKK